MKPSGASWVLTMSSVTAVTLAAAGDLGWTTTPAAECDNNRAETTDGRRVECMFEHSMLFSERQMSPFYNAQRICLIYTSIVACERRQRVLNCFIMQGGTAIVDTTCVSMPSVKNQAKSEGSRTEVVSHWKLRGRGENRFNVTHTRTYYATCAREAFRGQEALQYGEESRQGIPALFIL